MPSALETTLTQFRAALLRQEAAATGQVLTAYAAARARLVARIDGLTAILADRPLTGSEFFRLDRTQTLLRQVEAEMAALGVEAAPLVSRGAAAAVELAALHAQALTAVTAMPDPAVAARVASSWNRLNPQAVEALVGRYANTETLRERMVKLGLRAAERMTDANIDAIRAGLTEGVALGTHPRAVARKLATQLDVSAEHMLTVARTVQLDAYRDATLESYRQNADVLDGWRWTAAHDARTCLACLSLDGELFPLDTTFMPTHARCRCSPRPAVKGIPDPARRTGADWFAAQPEAVQRRMIPQTAWEEFRRGDLALDDFRVLDRDAKWGDSYREAFPGEARQQAARRVVVLKPKPTRTLTAQEQRLVDLGFEDATVDLGARSGRGKLKEGTKQVIEESARHVEAGLGEFADLGAPMPNRVSVGINPYAKGSAGFEAVTGRAGNVTDTRLDFNVTQAFEFYDAKAFMRRNYNQGWSSSDDEYHLVRHEFGHWLHWNNTKRVDSAGRVFTDESRYARTWTDPTDADTAKLVSRYAATKPTEFVAETFAGQMNGETYGEAVMDMYRRYGGPDVDELLKGERAAS